MAGYGIKVETDTGRFVWITETGTHVQKTAKGVWKFDSEAGAEMTRSTMATLNPEVNFIVKKF